MIECAFCFCIVIRAFVVKITTHNSFISFHIFALCACTYHHANAARSQTADCPNVPCRPAVHSVVYNRRWRAPAASSQDSGMQNPIPSNYSAPAVCKWPAHAQQATTKRQSCEVINAHSPAFCHKLFYLLFGLKRIYVFLFFYC